MEKYFEIIYMKADFEPWWQFDGWEEYIVERVIFETRSEFEAALEKKLIDMRAKYPCERKNKDIYYAFWNEDEQEYCEGCDEDAQIYHGIITKIPSFAS